MLAIRELNAGWGVWKVRTEGCDLWYKGGCWGLEPESPMTRMGAEVVTGACDKHEKPQGEGCRTQEENPGVCMGPADQGTLTGTSSA